MAIPAGRKIGVMQEVELMLYTHGEIRARLHHCTIEDKFHLRNNNKISLYFSLDLCTTFAIDVPSALLRIKLPSVHKVYFCEKLPDTLKLWLSSNITKFWIFNYLYRPL